MPTIRKQYLNAADANYFFIVTASSAFSYNVTNDDRYIFVTGTGDAPTIFNLPKPNIGEVHFFKDTSTSNGGTFSIVPFSGTIDGQSSLVFGARAAFGIVYDGLQWCVITSNTPRTPTEMIFTAGVFSTGISTPTRVGGRYIDLAPYIGTTGIVGTFASTVKFYANIETTAGTANVRLYNVTDGEVVTGSLLTTTNTTNTEVNGTLTVGSSVGNLKTQKVYEVDIFITGGGGTDRATCTNARLLFSYS